MRFIYDFSHYVDVIQWKIEMNAGENRYKTKLAEAAQCPPYFLL
jgi:hypothetical protein